MLDPVCVLQSVCLVVGIQYRLLSLPFFPVIVRDHQAADAGAPCRHGLACRCQHSPNQICRRGEDRKLPKFEKIK